jgi:hypothetical protein
MPNLKIHADEATLAARGAALRAALPEIRALICAHLAVPPGACQLAVVPVWGLEGQPPVNAELSILPHPERTPERRRALAEALQAKIADATETQVALRLSLLDRETFIALK